MKINTLTYLIFAFIALTAFQCEDDFPETPEGYELVYLRDYRGLDGCTWIFEREKRE